jgi:bifunctional DNase/RNase
MTHDLIANILRELGVRLIKVSVNDFDGSVHYATLHLQIGRGEENLQEVDARPSDAIALALRAQCRILVSSSVADKVGIQVEEADARDIDAVDGEEAESDAPDEIEKFSRLLEGVDLGESDKN